ncbi:MAG: carboxypeptidase-like regulatory domain-containing protein [Flavobacteriales bacterium]|nr:carboxypeptidase-like regulatory domain-containing protein [Flavobacteriales bacterium]
MRKAIAGIPGVVVSFGSGKGVSTNDSGRYEILLPAGDYTVQIRFIGYAERSIPVQVKQGSPTVLDAELMPSTSQLDMVVVSAGKFEQRVGEVTQSGRVARATDARQEHGNAEQSAGPGTRRGSGGRRPADPRG